jgi:hypothetical protein
MIVMRCGNAHNALTHTPLAALSAGIFKLLFITSMLELDIGQAGV